MMTTTRTRTDAGLATALRISVSRLARRLRAQRTTSGMTEAVLSETQLAALEGYQGQPWTADRVHLVRSRLGATEHPRYASLASWPLRVPPVTTTG